MTKDNIISLPNPHLRQISKKVGLITPKILKIINDMKLATLDWDKQRDHEVGVALAAVQIDQLYKIVIVRNNYEDKDSRDFTTFINPVITKMEGQPVEDYEGCLSVPNIYGKVARFPKVKLKATDIAGKEFRVTATDFLARIFQHEIDHLSGRLFIDHIKDSTDAFFELNSEGKLTPLNFDKDVRNNPILW